MKEIKETEFDDNGCPRNCPCREDYPDCYCQEILEDENDE